MNKLTDARSVEIFAKKPDKLSSRENQPLFCRFLGEVYFLKSQKDGSLREN
jgi:hypothetical protein